MSVKSRTLASVFVDAKARPLWVWRGWRAIMKHPRSEARSEAAPCMQGSEHNIKTTVTCSQDRLTQEASCCRCAEQAKSGSDLRQALARGRRSMSLEIDTRTLAGLPAPPENMVCPVSRCLLTEPVTLLNTGVTLQRSSAQKWYRTGGCSNSPFSCYYTSTGSCEASVQPSIDSTFFAFAAPLLTHC